MLPPPRLIIGLGNPGAEFEDTYHNVGFLAIDAIFKSENGEGPTESWRAHKKLFAYAHVPSGILMKPLTFMNDSGVAVKEAMKKFQAEIKDITVIHDESDLAVGTYKISQGKNAAGHNGVQSVIDHLGTNEFCRIRIGIRQGTETKRKKASDFVLAKITGSDRTAFQATFDKIKEVVRQ